MADNTVRLVILGKTGVGKSVVGNIIVGRMDAFEYGCGARSVTQSCQGAEVTEGGRRIEVYDTPGVMDTGRPANVVAREILRCIQVSSPGPHAFLLVIQLTRFTEEEHNAVKALQEIFGNKVADFMIVVFNRAEDLENTTIEEYVQGSTPELLNVIRACGGRYVPFYRDLNNRMQVANLVGMVGQVTVQNGGRHFSNEVYEDSKRESQSFTKRWLNDMTEKVGNMFRVLSGGTYWTLRALWGWTSWALRALGL